MESGLADLLVRRGVLSRDQLRSVLATQPGNLCLSVTLVRCGILSEADLATALEAALARPRVTLADRSIDPGIARLVPESTARRHHLLPIALTGRQLSVAFADPCDLSASNEVRLLTGYDVRPLVATVSELATAIDRCFSAAGTEPALPAPAPVDVTAEAPAVRLVDALLARAVERGASDIHFEPYEDCFRVRYRIDGLLEEVMRPPVALRDPTLSRLKILATLDIAERRLPQDGRFRLPAGEGPPIDFRISVLPTLHGEKVVLRLLDPSRVALELGALGFSPPALALLRHTLAQPHGMILVTGPTGSGKSSTLYAALAALNHVSRNLSTIEDPVELHLPGVNQVAVNDEIGLSFAAVLRALLRQDPDILMVGEIRDAETASMAVRAALTGHLVLTTLHANDTASALVRLIDMGVAPYLVASAVTLVIAQRLLRRRCRDCRGAEPAGPCHSCGGNRYRGRLALFEVLPVSATIRSLVQAGASAVEIRSQAIRDGLETLACAARRAGAAGDTDEAEILRTILPDTSDSDLTK